MADDYSLPLPLLVPVTDGTYEGLKKVLGIEETGNPHSLDTLIKNWINRLPEWHLKHAANLEELAAYLSVNKGIQKFMLDQRGWSLHDGTKEDEQFINQMLV